MAARTLLFGTLSFVSLGLLAQGNIPFDKEHITDADALKNAQAAMKKADALFDDGGTHYTEALALYQQAYALNPNNAGLNLKMGLCNLNGRFHHRALPFFEKAYALDANTPRIHFLLGFGHQLNAEWDKAVAEYDLHKASISRSVPDAEPMYNTADQRIAECQHGKAFQAKPTNGQVSNMGPTINSEVADYGVLITADGERMMFTSRRSNSTGGKINKATNEYFEDIYGCRKTENGWSEPLPLPAPVNSVINDASVGLFNDGRTMIIYRDVQGTGDLYESKREGDSWSEPVPMGENINSPDNETSAWFSFDRKQLFFVSDREGGIGGQDIWMSRWDETASSWGPATNLGPSVNTFEDEDGVFIHPDGRTLYFSSKGHDCMGGYDVFKSVLTDGKWSKAQNLGWPVNSPDDDLFFVLTANGTTGYFSSVRPNGLGEDDIYRVDFMPEQKGEETASMSGTGLALDAGTKTILLKGRIMDFKELAGMEASIELMDLSDARLIATFTSDPKTGEYMVAVPGGHDYAMSIRANGFLFHSENINVPEDGGTMEMKLDVTMHPMERGEHVVMRNIFFERDKAALNPTSLAELGQLLTLLRDNPKLRLEISGHTDSDGSEDHNDELSTTRAHAVMDHLVNNGITADRLEAVGYGASKPVAPNDTQENKARNRRTEVKVL
jgi:outer membrane protein OmpA-like peptidoglycan-associated protein